jgi:ATP-binding cassette subfamily B protein RaxB
MNNVCIQGEISECGLACLSHVSEIFETKTSLSKLREIFVPSNLGTTLAEMAMISKKIGIEGKPVSYSLELLDELPTPCILHLN